MKQQTRHQTGHIGIELEDALSFFEEGAKTNMEYRGRFGVGRQIARQDINKLLQEEVLFKIATRPPKYRLV